MPIGVAGAVALGTTALSVGSSLASGGGKQTNSGTQNTSNTTGPTAFNQPYIAQQFSGAQNLLNQQQATGPYTGQLYAGVNGQQATAANQGSAYGAGAGATLEDAGAAGLSSLYGNAGAYGTNAENMATNGTAAANTNDMNVLNGYATGADQASLVNPGLSSALNKSALGGTSAINGALSTLGQNSQTALQDPTKQISTDATAYMNNPGLAAQEAATNATINQTLNQTTLPGINQAAAMGGSLNSSRAGAANAEAQGQAATAMGSADASMINNAYNTGIGTATNTYENGLNASNSAASSAASAGLGTAGMVANLQNNEGQFNATTQLSAANSGISQQLASEGLNANTELSANAQLGQGVFDAALGTGNVQNGAVTDTQLAGAAGNLSQTNQQGIDNAGQQQFNNANTYNTQNMDNYANLVDNPSYSTSTGTGGSTSTTPGAGYIGTALGTAAGLNGLTGNPDGSNTAFSNAFSSLFGGNSNSPSYDAVGGAGATTLGGLLGQV